MLFTKQSLRSMTSLELHRELAHARNARDAYREGSVPEPVARGLRQLLDEVERRRAWAAAR